MTPTIPTGLQPVSLCHQLPVGGQLDLLFSIAKPGFSRASIGGSLWRQKK
jgi:hypothetical protein